MQKRPGPGRWPGRAILVAAASLAAGFLAAYGIYGLVGSPGTTGAPASARPAMPSLLATESPSPRPTTTPTTEPEPVTVWTTDPVALLSSPGDGGSADAHVGAAFPLELTSATSMVSGVLWHEVRWQTPGRRGIAWIAPGSYTTDPPAGVAEASFDALDLELAGYLGQLDERVGVMVLDVDRSTAYGFNADGQFTAASSIKVPIMLAFLTMLEAEGREPTPDEHALLSAMIQASDNDAATALYAEIGAERGMAAFIDGIGLEGLRPEGFTLGWGWSEISPAAMVELLERLHGGRILTAGHRDLALDLMRNVQPHLRYGVGDTAPEGATVAMKTGHVTGPDDRMAVNSSGIVTLAARSYIVAVYTRGNASLAEGQEIARRICSAIAAQLT